MEDNSPLSKALEDKRLPETLFRTLPAENHGTTKKPLTIYILFVCFGSYVVKHLNEMAMSTQVHSHSAFNASLKQSD